MSPDHWSKLTWDTVSAGGYDLFDPIGYLDRNLESGIRNLDVTRCVTCCVTCYVTSCITCPVTCCVTCPVTCYVILSLQRCQVLSSLLV